MIKFFRKIRQNLLSEGKTGKYLKYAIGEIVLVVIGILIALSINNWNEQQKINKEAHSIEISLYNDLVLDTLLLDNAIVRYESDLRYNSKLITRFQHPEATIDTLFAVAKTYDPSYTKLSNYNNSTYNSIISTGKIDYIEESLKLKLMNYQTLQKISLSDDNIKDLVFKTRAYTSKYVFFDHGKLIDEMAWDIKNKREFAILFANMSNYKNFMLQNHLKRYKNMLKANKELISLLQKNISID